jgi:leader peptidase (prepilin peptidase) / N-methyltransferase
MIRILGTILAALAGLAFGSFLNVCVTRWPADESIVTPRSHCRACNRTLAWWENIPALSWIALRGRCRTCSERISIRYPLVELALGGLWAIACIGLWPGIVDEPSLTDPLLTVIGLMILLWLLVALAVLDAENLWLPNKITFPGILLGLAFTTAHELLGYHVDAKAEPWRGLLGGIVAALIASGIVLLIRWIYWLVRRQEGIGMGDAKLMAMLGAWLGLPGALLAFVIGVVLGAGFALIVLASPRRGSESWATSKLPLGTFLCVGGIISALWGEAILNAYLRWSGLG